MRGSRQTAHPEVLQPGEAERERDEHHCNGDAESGQRQPSGAEHERGPDREQDDTVVVVHRRPTEGAYVDVTRHGTGDVVRACGVDVPLADLFAFVDRGRDA